MAEPGDEVVFIEPYYDSYAACVALAGASRRVVSLVDPQTGPSHWMSTHCGPRSTPYGAPAELTAQSDRNGADQVGTDCDRRAVRRARSRRDHRRGVEDLVYDGSRTYRCAPSRHGRAHLDDLQRRQDVQLTGWKIGWICGPPSWSRQHVRPSSSSPSSVARRSNPRWHTRCGHRGRLGCRWGGPTGKAGLPRGRTRLPGHAGLTCPHGTYFIMCRPLAAQAR